MMKLRFLTAGESHGKGLAVIVEGMVAGLALSEDYIYKELKRRQGGYGRGERMKIEQDRAEILSGVRQGLTLGSPIALWIRNRDWENWKEAMSVSPIEGEIEEVTRLRPGHADLAGALKYGQSDIRNILERASSRETAARVAAGAVARRLLEEFSIKIYSHVTNIGGILARTLGPLDWNRIEDSPVRCADKEATRDMVAAIDRAKKEGDTLGGIFELIAEGVPAGLGSHVHWDRRLDGAVAQAIMSINAVKGVEIGAGFTQSNQKGSEVHDIIEFKAGEKFPWKRLTNRAGGLEGGISNGEPIIVRAAVKPIATLERPLPSVDFKTRQPVLAHYERSDVCIVPAAGVIGEAMLALVLADFFLEKFGGDHLRETRSNYQSYLTAIFDKPTGNSQ